MKHKEAAEAYIKASKCNEAAPKYNEAASEYMLGQVLVKAVVLVVSYHAFMDAELINEIKSLGKYVYLSDHRLK